MGVPMTEGPGARGANPDRGDAVPGPSVHAPSEADVERFREQLTERGDAYRTRTSIELTFVDALLRMGAPDGAAQVLQEYETVLRAYSADVDELVAESTRTPRVAPPSPAPPVQPPAEPLGHAYHAEPADHAEPAEPAEKPAAPAVRPLRRVLVGALLSAVIAAAVLAPPWQRSDSGDVGLASAELEAQEELAIARQRLSALQAAPAPEQSVTAEARALHDQILALPDDALRREVVREQIRELLDLERVALEEVAAQNPEALDLLGEIRAIRTSLALDGPVQDPAPVEVPTRLPVEPWAGDADDALPVPAVPERDPAVAERRGDAVADPLQDETSSNEVDQPEP
jgi:hypothetical protein